VCPGCFICTEKKAVTPQNSTKVVKNLKYVRVNAEQANHEYFANDQLKYEHSLFRNNFKLTVYK